MNGGRWAQVHGNPPLLSAIGFALDFVPDWWSRGVPWFVCSYLLCSTVRCLWALSLVLSPSLSSLPFPISIPLHVCVHSSRCVQIAVSYLASVWFMVEGSSPKQCGRNRLASICPYGFLYFFSFGYEGVCCCSRCFFHPKTCSRGWPFLVNFLLSLFCTSPLFVCPTFLFSSVLVSECFPFYSIWGTSIMRPRLNPWGIISCAPMNGSINQYTRRHGRIHFLCNTVKTIFAQLTLRQRPPRRWTARDCVTFGVHSSCFLGTQNAFFRVRVDVGRLSRE